MILVERPVIADAISYRAGPGWHVVEVDEGEADVHLRLHQAGFATWTPHEKIKATPSRPHLPRYRPLLPGYLFVLFDHRLDAWKRIPDLRGVSQILSNNGLPLRVPTAWIEALRYAEKVGEFDRTKVDPDGFKVGETVRIGEGPFVGHNALIQEFIAKMKSTTARKRAKLLFNFLGRMTMLDLPVTGLEKL